MRQNSKRDVSTFLGLLLQLQRRARQAGANELPFIFVNETRVLVPYRQAVFWQAGRDGTWKVASVSGLASPDPGAPFVLWLNSLCKVIRRIPTHTAVTPIDKTMISEDLSASWAEWLPQLGLWFPLYSRGILCGALALFREEPFHSDETELLQHLTESYGQCLLPPAPLKVFRSKFNLSVKNWRLWLAGTLCLMLLLPLRQSVLAPAEVVALHPAHIRATLDGVVKTFFVEPNHNVAIGDKLLSLEDDQLKTRLLVSQKNLEMAKVELQQAQQMSLIDVRSKVRLPMLQGRVDQLLAELALVDSQLARVLVVSPVSGVAVFDNPDVWLGRPVSLGQKIMEVTDPAKVQLEITLPMSETLPLQRDDTILFFPNISPHSPLSGTLTFIGYQASETPGAGLAFTLRAHFSPDESVPRLGLRGTAKLYGARMPLIALLLRRPFLQLREWLGV